MIYISVFDFGKNIEVFEKEQRRSQEKNRGVNFSSYISPPSGQCIGYSVNNTISSTISYHFIRNQFSLSYSVFRIQCLMITVFSPRSSFIISTKLSSYIGGSASYSIQLFSVCFRGPGQSTDTMNVWKSCSTPKPRTRRVAGVRCCSLLGHHDSTPYTQGSQCTVLFISWSS